MVRRYKATSGAPFPKKDAQKIGRWCEQLEKENNVVGLEPEMLVEDAKKPSSPGHKLFPWDEKKAANQHWLNIARNILNHMVVVIVTESGPIETKAYHSVRVKATETEPAKRFYASLRTVQGNMDMRHQVIAGALRELQYWKAKYSEYKELFPVMVAIEKASKRIKAGVVPMTSVARRTR